MRLMRNEAPGGLGKYGLIDNRTGHAINPPPGDPDEFFVIKLKDMFAPAALRAYAEAAKEYDMDYATDVFELAVQAEQMPNRKYPD